MPKRKNLNGLPHNLTRSFFGTNRYYKCGYVADWIINGARILNLKEATADILNINIDPPELNFAPTIAALIDLKKIIAKELSSNQFSPDFITEAKIRIEFLSHFTHSKTMYCYPILRDKQGHYYQPGRIIAEAYEDKFDPFILEKKRNYLTQSIFNKLMSLFK